MITTPRLWRHKWRPATLCPILDDFRFKYVGKRHAHHLQDILKEHYTITEYWTAYKFSGVDIHWDYQKRTCRLYIKDYIRRILLQHGHPHLSKIQLSPHYHVDIDHGYKAQYETEPKPIPPMHADGIKRVQEIVGGLMYYTHAVDNNLLAALSEIGLQQAVATKRTNYAITQLLNYVATYPKNGIIY